MSSARGRANHALYLARILIGAWRRDLDTQSVAAKTLASAYWPGVRNHLTNAYGWFLVEITRPGGLPETPPQCLAELPEIVAGKAMPGEIREFQRLEREGWIGAMLSAESDAPQSSSMHNLAVAATGADPEQAETWANLLQQLFDRMGDSLDEY